ncbi:helix-turn-helix domain-containing protein [Mycobacteroides abscessus]|uniref:helix-turn-helix domain-containing protein n=1 Tax=Mycobacteroides abscessus TaxID=36809 RepID=UPI00078E04A0|nr:helix-turn-helix domain-containing protein [Mycobacteroides abscessus]AMU70942.1 hypothetical protein A3O05_13510 [Mycobacteroides abscessus]MDM2016413.1 helix-turn-helix domain-containing protein [Mycobacteroides abscessus]MDM2020735.1 helix-turn-helix domain-containing protein [Mycobacteroides abscessus]MDM2025818.1 helix-turn-helix domain-containing protein [Mycobacteroides abscessus]MDM2029860.1 helix-turn-helix domain-containing protein [Mycobacteroides abscessus]
MARAQAAARSGKGYVGITEAAEYLGVNHRTVRNAISDGRLKGYRFGATIRLRLDEIDDALQPVIGAV